MAVTMDLLLTPLERMVFVAWLIDGKSLRDIADEGNTTSKTIDNALLRARNKMQDHDLRRRYRFIEVTEEKSISPPEGC